MRNRVLIYSAVFRHILAFVTAILVSWVSLSCARDYHNSFPEFGNMLSYFGCFVGLPFCILLLLWDIVPFRGYMVVSLAVTSLLVSMWYYQGICVIQKDINDYLAGETPFVHAAKMVLPNPILLDENSEYRYVKTNTGFECIELTLTFPDGQHDFYASNQAQLLHRYVENNSGFPYYFRADTERFLLNHHEYSCYTFNVDGVNYATSPRPKTMKHLSHLLVDLSDVFVPV